MKNIISIFLCSFGIAASSIASADFVCRGDSVTDSKKLRLLMLKYPMVYRHLYDFNTTADKSVLTIPNQYCGADIPVNSGKSEVYCDISMGSDPMTFWWSNKGGGGANGMIVNGSILRDLGSAVRLRCTRK